MYYVEAMQQRMHDAGTCFNVRSWTWVTSAIGVGMHVRKRRGWEGDDEGLPDGSVSCLSCLTASSRVVQRYRSTAAPKCRRGNNPKSR